MTLKDRLRWSLWFTPSRDPIAELEASITAGCAKRKVEREGRRAAALRGMGQ